MFTGERVVICEVGPRDGFQIEPEFLSTNFKVETINALARTGIPSIQVTSFVHPKAVPQMADAEEVSRRIERLAATRYSALVLNLKGAERAVAAGYKFLDAVVSVTDSHSLSNANMTTAQAMDRLGQIARLISGTGAEVTAGFAVALGCPFEGFPPYERVERLVSQAVEAYGLARVAIADTAGMAGPRLVYQAMSKLIERFPGVIFSLHLHDTRGTGLPNVLVGMEAGVRHFDSSIGGLGGCPFCPGATGNISTEDIVHMLQAMGVQTGIDIAKLLEVGRRVAEVVGHADSRVLKVGTSEQLVARMAAAAAALRK